MDYTAITGAVDMTGVLAAVGAVAAVMATVYVARAGWNQLKGMLKGA